MCEPCISPVLFLHVPEPYNSWSVILWTEPADSAKKKVYGVFHFGLCVTSVCVPAFGSGWMCHNVIGKPDL